VPLDDDGGVKYVFICSCIKNAVNKLLPIDDDNNLVRLLSNA
jgi:hypothetical protein